MITTATMVEIISGGIALLKSLPLFLYIIKKIKSGPKSAKNLTKDLFTNQS